MGKKSVDTFNRVKHAWAMHKDPRAVARQLNITAHTVKFYLKQMNVEPPSNKEMKEKRKRRFLSVVVPTFVPGVIWFGFENKNIKNMSHKYEAFDHRNDTTINPIVSQVNNQGNFVWDVAEKEADQLLLVGVDESGTVEVVYYMPRNKAPKKRFTLNRQGKPNFIKYVHIHFNEYELPKLEL